jgi:hypothetical protein
MIVGKYFDDDSITVAIEQHDSYGEALNIICTECQSMKIRAARILGLNSKEYYEIKYLKDHRTLQYSHDLIAAAWRYKTNAAQLKLSFRDNQLNIRDEWLNWLRSEIISWYQDPHLVKLTNLVIENQNIELGYRSEQKLILNLLDRFQHIPWESSVLKLQRKLLNGLN